MDELKKDLKSTTLFLNEFGPDDEKEQPHFIAYACFLFMFALFIILCNLMLVFFMDNKAVTIA